MVQPENSIVASVCIVFNSLQSIFTFIFSFEAYYPLFFFFEKLNLSGGQRMLGNLCVEEATLELWSLFSKLHSFSMGLLGLLS